MKRVILNCLVIAGLTLGVNAQDIRKVEISSRDVPKAVMSKFNSTFPKASDVEWKKKGNDYKVSFEMNRIDHHATFNNTGVLQERGKEIRAAQLPSSIRAAVKRDHPKHKIDDVHTMLKGGVTNYKVSLDGTPDRKVIYSATGKALKDQVDD